MSLDTSPVEVTEKAAVGKRNVGASEVGVGESSPGSCRHGVPVVDPVRTAGGLSKLKGMVERESSKVFDLDVVARPRRVGVGRVVSMSRSSSTNDARVSVGRVVKPDNNTLPVMTMATSHVSVDRLILGPVPGVHDSKPASMPGGSGIDLTFACVTATTTAGSRILKTPAVEEMSQSEA